jgi:acyl dehydratase
MSSPTAMCSISGSPIEFAGRLMDLLWFEDFHVGEIVEYGSTTVTAEAIVEFARQFDPQAFHLDDSAARETMTEGLIASGWHTAAILMRMSCDHFLNRSTCQGAPGIEEISWVKPVRPGDTLGVRRATVGARVSRSRPELGLVEFVLEAVNQSGEVVMIQRGAIFFKRRSVDARAPQ